MNQFQWGKMTVTPSQSFIGDTQGLPMPNSTTSHDVQFSGIKMTQSTSDDTAKTHSGSQNEWAFTINGNSNIISIATKIQSDMDWSSDTSQPHSGIMQPNKTSFGTTSMRMELMQPQTHSGSSTASEDNAASFWYHQYGNGNHTTIQTHSGSLNMGWSSQPQTDTRCSTTCSAF